MASDLVPICDHFPPFSLHTTQVESLGVVTPPSESSAVSPIDQGHRVPGGQRRRARALDLPELCHGGASCLAANSPRVARWGGGPGRSWGRRRGEREQEKGRVWVRLAGASLTLARWWGLGMSQCLVGGRLSGRRGTSGHSGEHVQLEYIIN